jgi:hypothetical protein
MNKSTAGFIKARKITQQFSISNSCELICTAFQLALAVQRLTQGEQTVQCTVE